MSDQRLRELERRWRETGRVEDEAAYLRERVRMGGLMQDRLELAAYCGHPGARVATQATTECASLPQWLGGLLGYGKEVAFQGLLTLGSLLLPRWETNHRDDHRPRRALEAAERCLTDASPDASAAALAAGQSAMFESALDKPGGWSGYSFHQNGTIAALCGMTATLASRGEPPSPAHVEQILSLLADEDQEWLLESLRTQLSKWSLSIGGAQ